MEKYFGEKQQRFSFRKLSVGLVSTTISSLFFMSVLGSSSVEAQETKGVHYKYVTESELSSDEKKQLVYDIPTCMENDDETYYLVYKLNSQNQLGELPNTGSKNDMKTLVAGASLAALGILIFAVSKKKVKNKTVLHLVLVAGIGNSVLVSAHALENNLLLNYNTDYELTTGEKLPLPKEISGYTYIGYIKEGNITSESKVNNQEKSVATPTKQQKVDYSVTPNFVENPSKVQVINGQYETVPEFRDGQVGALATESAATKADTLSSDMNSEVESHSTPPTVDSSQNGENLGKKGEDATPVEKPKEQEPEKTEEVPVKPTEGAVEGTSNQGAENPVQSAEESTANSEKVSPDTSSENTGEVSSNPSDSTTSVEETNKPEKDESKDETSTKPENSGNATTENGQTEPEQSNGNSTEDVSSESNTANSNGNEEIKQENEVEPDKKVEVQEKTIELRSVSDVELYSYEGNQSKQHTSLDKVPDNKSDYFIKVKSAKFKDVLLPVSNIEDTTKDGKAVYKITARLEHLKQSVDNQYQDNFTYYLPKLVQNDGPIYTSFKKLVTDMNRHPGRTFTLGATMNAREVELGENQESYITNNFTGKLIGSHQGKHYAIYNLKKPLFNRLEHATVKDLTLKDVNISGKNHVASVAKEATNSSTLENVHANGIIAGELGIGGLVQKVNNSTVRNSSFTGRITNTFVTRSQYAIGGLVGQLTGANARVDHSIATVVISSNGEHSNQTIGGIAGIVENNATVENSYAEGEINNAKPFARVGGVAGSLWTQEGGTDNNTGRLTNVLSDMNITNGNAISGYHFNGIKETNVYSNKENKVVNVQAVGDEVMSVDSTVERGTEIEKTAVQAKKEQITKKHTITVEDFTNSVKQDVDYTKATHYQVARDIAYKNIEKLLPFYNRDTIVKYGNQLSTDHNLFKKELLSVVAMKNEEVVSDITSNKNSINHLLLHYKDGTSEKVNVTYHSDFANLAEYTIGTTGLVYTSSIHTKCFPKRLYIYNRQS